MESLLLQQEDLLDNLENLFSNYKKSPKDRLSQSYIQARLDNLEKMWVKFTENHYSLVGSVKKAERLKITYFEDKCFSQAEDIYLDCRTKMSDELVKITQKEVVFSEDNNQPSCDVRLPQIQLCTFSGKYEEWQEFYDMFSSVIHTNNKLSSVQKLHYLKGSLTGEAANLLKNLPTTENNYEEAWSQLKRRFTNKRYNCNAILNRLFSQKPILTESALAIKSLLDTTSACLKLLQNIGINIESWDPVINFITTSKLDVESRKQWETKLSELSDDEIPKWEKLCTFLEARFRTLEMLEGSRSIQNCNSKIVTKQRSFHSVTVQDKKRVITCVMCSGQHHLYQCKQFGKLIPNERVEYVRIKGLCFNCFAPTHCVKYCHQSTCCRRCGRRHHTMLHLDKFNTNLWKILQRKTFSLLQILRRRW